ncbi:hypothetical protein [Coleofasciculus sp. LEGE 07081]|nr:hypothetical protein [Coleofasciculus sp. LEGE 07081]
MALTHAKIQVVCNYTELFKHRALAVGDLWSATTLTLNTKALETLAPKTVMPYCWQHYKYRQDFCDLRQFLKQQGKISAKRLLVDRHGKAIEAGVELEVIQISPTAALALAEVKL